MRKLMRAIGSLLVLIGQPDQFGYPEQADRW